MNSIATIAASLGLYRQAAALAKKERMMISICNCTGLSFGEVMKKTRGRYLDVVLEAAALSGECMEYEVARRYLMAESMARCQT